MTKLLLCFNHWITGPVLSLYTVSVIMEYELIVLIYNYNIKNGHGIFVHKFVKYVG
jgi:hypothetical protein